ncbi:unnamed protein product [Adineta steineri]|uniref:Uncharacterized protein n=1 Tax=Adineta steineri TaxID=433720 RepID=A0A813S567_9BILA|nr:unnamed protein product [Adineta steineri]
MMTVVVFTEEQPTAANATSEEITVQETINQAPSILSMIDINEVDQDKYNYEQLKNMLKAAIPEHQN